MVAAEITQQANDSQQLAPMIKQVAVNMGRKPEAVSADAGYWSEANVSDERVAGVDLYIATGRRKHGEKVEPANGPPPADATVKQAMQPKLRTEDGHSIYKMRKAIVEPVFGQTKERRLGFRKALPAAAHRLLRLVWKLQAQSVEHIARGPRRMDSKRLLARMIRRRREFRQHGFEIQFTPSPADPKAERDFRG